MCKNFGFKAKIALVNVKDLCNITSRFASILEVFGLQQIKEKDATMLVISRKIGDSIRIGDDINIVILRVGNTVRIGIEAPKNVSIVRDDAKTKQPKMIEESEILSHECDLKG